MISLTMLQTITYMSKKNISYLRVAFVSPKEQKNNNPKQTKKSS